MTFSDVLEGLRSDLAKRYLADKDLSISEIAWLLGYQEVSAFTHACRRWTGQTPREARAQISPSARRPSVRCSGASFFAPGGLRGAVVQLLGARNEIVGGGLGVVEIVAPAAVERRSGRVAIQLPASRQSAVDLPCEKSINRTSSSP